MEPVLSAIGIGGSKPDKVQVEPVPTRNTAADAIAATQAEQDKRRSWATNSSGSTQLTPTGGVASDFTGTRMLSGRAA